VGSHNNFIGVWAGRFNTEGNNNNFIGNTAGERNATGSNNNFIGCSAGACNTTGVNNLFFGHNAGTSGTPDGLANITTESNRIIMGNANHDCAQIQIAWTVVSDIRDKCVFGTLTKGKHFLRQINPIEYAFKDRTTGELKDPVGKRRYGFSAQEILEAENYAPVIVSSEDPEKLQVTSDYIIPVLVNAVKELSTEIDELKQQIEQLKNKI
jgi:hypothetical protein